MQIPFPEKEMQNENFTQCHPRKQPVCRKTDKKKIIPHFAIQTEKKRKNKISFLCSACAFTFLLRCNFFVPFSVYKRQKCI